MTTFTEKKKADRAKMAEIVRALAVEMGCEAEIEDKPYGEISPQMVMVKIRTDRGLKLTIDFDGKSCQPDVHVMSWHMDTKVDTRLADAFGDINPYHFCKATDVAYGFDSLIRILSRKLELCRTGAAYSPEREAASIAKDGTAAERAARFAAYRAELEFG